MDWLAHSIFSNDERVIKIAQDYAQAEEEYRAKFGEDSLDYVLELPHPNTSCVSSYLESIEDLKKRILINDPFENIKSEFDVIY